MALHMHMLHREQTETHLPSLQAMKRTDVEQGIQRILHPALGQKLALQVHLDLLFTVIKNHHQFSLYYTGM